MEYKILQRKYAELKKRNVTGLQPEISKLDENWGKIDKIIADIKSKEVIPEPKPISASISNDGCPPIVKPKPISLVNKDKGTMSNDFVMKINKLREQIATHTRAVGASEDILVICKTDEMYYIY